MDAQHLPAVVGTCVHCGLPLYAGAPRMSFPELAHVGCAVDACRAG